MLAIYPPDCIDCVVCVSDCPVDAITGPVYENDDLSVNERYWLELNYQVLDHLAGNNTQR